MPSCYCVRQVLANGLFKISDYPNILPVTPLSFHGEEQISGTNSTIACWIAHFFWKVIKITSWEEATGGVWFP